MDWWSVISISTFASFWNTVMLQVFNALVCHLSWYLLLFLYVFPTSSSNDSLFVSSFQGPRPSYLPNFFATRCFVVCLKFLFCHFAWIPCNLKLSVLQPDSYLSCKPFKHFVQASTSIEMIHQGYDNNNIFLRRCVLDSILETMRLNRLVFFYAKRAHIVIDPVCINRWLRILETYVSMI